MNLTASGNFSGGISLATSGVLPSGVTVSFQQSSVNAPGNTTVTVTASSTASSGTITIAGTSGSLNASLTIPVTVTAAPPAPYFSATGNGTSQFLNVPNTNSNATFTIAFTGVNGFPANQPISLSVGYYTTSHISVSITSGNTVYAGGAATVVVTGLGGTAFYTGCATIIATSGTLAQYPVVCINTGIPAPNISFVLPSSTVTIPQGGSATVLGTVSTTSTASVTFAASVTCASGVSCSSATASATLSNGVVKVVVNLAGVPARTAATLKVSANGGAAQYEPIYDCDPNVDCTGIGNAPVITPQDSPFTYNDGSVSPSFFYTCQNCSPGQVISCSVGTNGNIGVHLTYAGNQMDFYLTFQASPGLAVGNNYPVSCQLGPGGTIFTGYMAVQQGGSCSSPTINSVLVDGASTNTIILGTSGYMLINGTCLGGAQQPTVDGNGITISSYTLSNVGGGNYQIYATFQSSATGSNGGSHNLTVVASQGRASTTVFGTKVTLSSISFTNSVAYSRDCEGAAVQISPPTWPSATSSLCPQISKYSGDHAVYASGSRMNANAVFTLTRAAPQSIPAAYVQGSTSTFGTFVATGVVVPANQGSFGVPVVVDTPFPPSQTQFVDPLSISWSVGEAGSSCSNGSYSCVGVGNSANPIYVTLAPSVLPASGPPSSSPFYAGAMLTYFSLAVGTGGAVNQSGALASTWAKFSTGSGPADVTTWDGRTMSYYTAGFGSCAKDASQVVQNLPTTSAQCGAFALLLESALASNGIHSTWIQVTAADRSITPSLPPSKMVINNWMLSSTPFYAADSPSIAPWIYKVVMNSPLSDYMIPAQPGGVYGDLTNIPGNPGQGDSATTPPNTPVEKIFDYHFIVQVGCASSSPANPQIGCISMPNPPVKCVVGVSQTNYGSGTVFFDPSYGVTYQSEATFESQSVTGYVNQNNGDPVGGTSYHFRGPSPGVPNVCFIPVPARST